MLGSFQLQEFGLAILIQPDMRTIRCVPFFRCGPCPSSSAELPRRAMNGRETGHGRQRTDGTQRIRREKSRSFASLRMTAALLRMTAALLRMTAASLRMMARSGLARGALPRPTSEQVDPETPALRRTT